MDAAARDPRHWQVFFGAEGKLFVSHREVAERAPEPVREKARMLAAKAMSVEQLVDHIGRYRTIVNYEYWRTRCEVEQTETAVTARKLVYHAQQKLREGVLTTASGLTFTGDSANNALALRSSDGSTLWHAAIGRVGNSPITYELDGRQYVLFGGGPALYAFALP